MKKVLLFVAVLSVVSLSSCKKDCTYPDDDYYSGGTCCTDCKGIIKDACEASGATCK